MQGPCGIMEILMGQAIPYFGGIMGSCGLNVFRLFGALLLRRSRSNVHSFGPSPFCRLESSQIHPFSGLGELEANFC